MAERGLWPSAGGWGDQTAACVDGVNAVWAFKNRVDELKAQGKTL
jgi:hypothetical protein